MLCTTFGSNGAFAQDLTSCGEGYFIDLSVGYTPLGIGLELCGCSNQVKNCELVHIVMSQEANSQVVPLDCPSITLTERWWREGKDLVDIYDPITCEEYNESTTYTDRYEIPTGHLNGGDTLSILVCKTDPEDINLIEVSASPGPECEPIPCVPQMECPVEEKLYVGTDCAHLLPNFIEDIILYDTCFSPKVDVTEDFVIMQFPEPGTIVTSDLFVEITIANDEGMELATCDISVLVVEDRGPTFETMPIIEDIIVGEALPDLIELSAHDTTDQGILDIPVVSSIDPYDVDACGGYPITYRWLAIDHCENQTEIEVTFNVLPNSDGPRFATLPADIDTVFPGEMWPLLVDLVAVNPDGTTDGIDVVSSIDPYEEEICEGFPVTYRWVATDSCGTTNQISKTFFVAPHDDGPVFLEEPDPIDDIMQNDTLPDFQELQVVNAVGTSLGIEVVNYIDTTLFDPCSPYEITYTWTATDTCGYS